MEKVTICLESNLLARLDRTAAERGLSRSALIAELAARGLDEPLGPGARPEVGRALERIQELFRDVDDIDSTQIIREMRDSR